MVRRFLITTALEETWRDDERVLFLGEWCRRYSRKDRWSRMDAEVLPYHWDDREKLYADYHYLQDLYECLLQGLTAQLNRIHGVDHSLRYWRILVGPWLGTFTQILFDRWTSIQQAVTRYELSETIVLREPEGALIPTDMPEFCELIEGDEWNHDIYSTIIQHTGTVPCSQRMQIHHEGVTLTRPATTPTIPGGKTRRLLRGWYTRLAGIWSRDEDAFFIGTYLPHMDEMRLQLRFRQVPQLWRRVLPRQVAPDRRMRAWSLSSGDNTSFELFAGTMIARQIPSIYLEGYAQLLERTEELPWPDKPKIMWTSVEYNTGDVFKAWAAEKVEQGTPLVIGQHGGGFGTHLWGFYEDHILSIGDAFLSWGWEEVGQPRVKRVGQLTAKRPLGIRHANQAGILLVTCSQPRQSYYMYSVVVSRQWLDYFDDQCAFVGSLPARIRDALTVRLYARDYGWDQVARWRDRFPDLRLDDGRSDITNLICQSRLYIATYNATTFLEAFTMNIPTVMFWNPSHWELRNTAIPYFDDLKRVGIFHETPECAARHVAAIWDDVEAWWTSPTVREVLGRFKARYCFLPDDLLDRAEHVLREVMAVSDKATTQ